MVDNVIAFPAPVVPLRIATSPRMGTPREEPPLLAVEHDGRVYSLATLLARLPDALLDELDELVPQSAQQAWDLVVRRWPRIAQAAVDRG
ncbi:hypothetical protein [Lichenicoccus roseus]|uniref:Uncharacterized protein n=1 Tax=Lichenicoccus roseus TaxID=2683649 RepID=A0A5R9J9C0_9PROT|nr:hypothetical protein [Lichenicoccus roseus]TLU74200.1 hypothetical protein FE263_03040 [Lichenicoccus roseus]